jgi:hypothetical protein
MQKFRSNVAGRDLGKLGRLVVHVGDGAAGLHQRDRSLGDPLSGQ